MHKPEQCPPDAEPMPTPMPTSNALSMPKGCPTMPEVEVEVENYKTLNSPSIPTSATSTRDAQTVDGPDLVECRTCRQPRPADSYCARTPACETAARQHIQSMQRLTANPSTHTEPQQPSEEWTGRASGHARSVCSPLMPIGERCRSAQFWDQLVKVVCQGPAWSAWCAFSELDERGPCDEVMIDFLTKVLADA